MEQPLKLYNKYQIADIGEYQWYEGIFKEIWYDHEYSRYGVEVEKGDIVLDCGANVGFFSLYALNYKKADYVYSIECETKNIICLHHNLKDKNAKVIDNFISNEGYNLDVIMKEFNLPYIDFAKIDIEYWEYDLLLNMSDDTMRKINKWAIELHGIWDNSHNILHILEKFSKNGFQINYEQIHKETNLAILYAKKR